VLFHRIQSTILYGKNSNDDEDDGNEMKEGGTTVKPTWTYVPYKPPPPGRKKGPNRYQNGQQPRRNFHSRNNDNWVVPNKVSIPEDKIEMSFTRSSGAGGQNVNKVCSLCFVIRFFFSIVLFLNYFTEKKTITMFVFHRLIHK
jgi:hypothetical protein